MTKYKNKSYFTLFTNCGKRECFVPYSGNGHNVCRMWELGKCRGQWNDKIGKRKKVNELQAREKIYLEYIAELEIFYNKTMKQAAG